MKPMLSVLWLVLLLGVLAHSVLGIVPLLYGQIPSSPQEPLQQLLWQLTLVFSSYLALAVLVLLVEAKWSRWLNLAASGFFLLSNTLHAGAHFFLSPIEWHQVFLLALVAMLNAVHFKLSVAYLMAQ